MEMNDDATCYATCKGMITLNTVVKSWFVTAYPTGQPAHPRSPCSQRQRKRGCGYHTS